MREEGDGVPGVENHALVEVQLKEGHGPVGVEEGVGGVMVDSVEVLIWRGDWNWICIRF